MKYYSEEHVWIEPEAEEGIAVVGISRHAQETLGDIVAVDLPAPGQRRESGSPGGVVESTKTAADVHMPVDVEILGLNEEAISDPEKVTQDPEGEGWLLRVRILDTAQLETLMTGASYSQSFG